MKIESIPKTEYKPFIVNGPTKSLGQSSGDGMTIGGPKLMIEKKGPLSFVVVQQTIERGTEVAFTSAINGISIISSLRPEFIEYSHKLYVWGVDTDHDDRLVEIDSTEYMERIARAIKEFNDPNRT